MASTNRILRIRELKHELAAAEQRIRMAQAELDEIEVQPALYQLVEMDSIEDEHAGKRYMQREGVRIDTAVVSVELEPGELTPEEQAWVDSDP